MTRSTLSRPGVSPPERRRSTWGGALLGVGLMAALDEIVFHQLLAWHHFYDRATPAVSLLSDGLLHSGELVAFVAGVFVLADLLRAGTFSRAFGWAGLFLGMGAFQLFDGLVDHKVLRLHQVRYEVPLLPYDLLWNLAGVVLLLIGVALWVGAARRVRPRS